MTSDKTTMAITADEFADYLNSKNAKSVCIMCGHPKMVFLSDDNDAPAKLGMVVSGGGGFISFYAVVCGSCSHAEYFYAHEIEAKIVARREENASNK